MFEMTSMEAFILALGALGFGIVLLIRGGNWTIDSSVFIARKLGISPLLVGFTIVAFGTSLPELIVSVNASFHHLPGIAVGNVIGSNIANILLVIGATASFVTLHVVRRDILRDLTAMIIVTLVLTALMLYGEISRTTGFIMLGALILYTSWQYLMASKGAIKFEEPDNPEFPNMLASIGYLFLGLLFIALGAEILVRGAKVSAIVIGVPEDVIGLSVIAFGTSLPELSTCLIAAKRKQFDLVIGNIIGSNVFNILMIIGATAITKDIIMMDMAKQLVTLDIWVVLGVSVLFTALLLSYQKVTRPIGVIFTMGYIAYIGTIYALYFI